MVTLADSLVSSSARVLPVRMRPDLTALQQRYQGQLYWVVKEPVGLHYFRFQEEEYSILQMLDGETSLDQIKIEFERRFPPQKITVEELGNFVGMLHRNGLVISNISGQGEQLRKRRTEKKWREAASMFTNLLALRFKGIDPDRILNWLYPKMRWIYSWQARLACAMLMLSALALVIVQFDEFHKKLPTFNQFFEAKNWIYLGVTLCITKVIHEFGHGLTCKHFGGECHEMGVMFLVLTPCLYCNVSDSWMLPNKWHRAWIGAAGMYVEVVIASICTFLWWFSEPGLLHQLCLSTMFICSVSTVLFNANPLLRYDGYYILADLIEIPNLRQKSSTILNHKLGYWCLGLEEPDDPFLPQRNQALFAVYTVASMVYRLVVLFGIIWFLYKVFEPYGLKVISQTLAATSVVSLVAMPIYKLWKFFSIPGKIDKMKRANIQATLGVLTALALFIIFCPLPYRVICTLELKPLGAEPVYAVVPGLLREVNVRPGQKVQVGDKLGRLSNIDLELEIGRLEAELDERLTDEQVILQEASGTGSQSEGAARRLPEIEKRIDALKQQLAEKKRDQKRLTLEAHTNGIVMPPPEVPARPDRDPRDLSSWKGSPLEANNLGAYLAGALFCQIGDPTRWEAMLYIDQDEVPFVHEKQSVAIKLDEFPYKTFYTTISEMGPEVVDTPRQLSSKSGGEFMSKTDEGGKERPLSKSFRASAPIEDKEAKLVQGLRGTAKVYANWQSLGTRLWRYLIRTFNFKL